ncbi:hypothetical protein J3R83DRAFT_3763 [Lanmaoa asiatica]|nr:hypothetical protein J3R83DRAFT_3763 [Lanmaoa asiatica]
MFFNIGSLAAYPFSPYMTGGLGRRFSVLFGAAVMIAATALQTASRSVQMFIGARFMIGFGLTFAANAAPLLVTELAYPSHRGVLTSTYNSLWFVIFLQTYGTFHTPNNWAWRIPSALQGLPSVIQICLVWFVPGSPSLARDKGREAQALRILGYYHANGNELSQVDGFWVVSQDPLVGYEFKEIKEAIKLNREVSAIVGWTSLFKTVGNRKRVRIITALAFFSQWSGNGLILEQGVQRYRELLLSPTTQLLVNGFLNIWSLICALTGSVLCDKAGRRPLFLTAISGMLLFWTLQTVSFAVDSTYHDINAGYAVIAMIFLYSTFYTVAFSPLIVSYTVEILPFSLRAKGFTWFSFIVSLSVIFNQYVNPIALAASEVLRMAFVVYALKLSDIPPSLCSISLKQEMVFFPLSLTSRPSTDAMVATPIKPQRLSTRDDGGENSNWGTMQIAAPVIVGGVLLLAFVAYIFWERNPLRKRSYDYRRVRTDWVTKIERMFVPRRTRQRVLHSSVPMTLDDSMRLSVLTLDSRRARQYRSGSSDSQTPLTNDIPDYPPKRFSDSPPPIAKRRALRWWWIFGSRPQEVKSEEPGLRWRVDGPDGSSTGHGHSSHGHEEYHTRYVGALEAVHEDREEVGDRVIRIGEHFPSVASTPMTQHFPEHARAVHWMSTVPEYPGSSGARTPAPAASAIRSNPGTPVSSASRGLPPSYDVSQSHTHYASAEDIARLTRSELPYMVIPPPVRTAGYSSPRVFHGRDLSTDSFLATQPPMATTSIY